MPELAFEPLRRAVLQRLESLSKGLAGAKVPGWADPEGKRTAALTEARRRLEDHIRFRFGRGLGAPAMVVLFGGTGVGKSTILNTIVGRTVTETSARRPCTTEPLLFHHESARADLEGADFLPAYAKKAHAPGQPKAGSMGVELLSHREDRLASLVLVDAPDFDSVEKENRRVAEDLYRVADLVIFVVNPAKYADEETWKAIRRAKADGKTTAFVFNRAEKDDPALADFRQLVDGSALIEVARDPGAAQAGRIEDPAVRERLEGILRTFLLGEAADRLRLAELRRSWDAFVGLMDAQVLPGMQEATDVLRRGREAAVAAAKVAEKALVEEVKLDQSNDLERVSRMVRENLFSVVGFLTKKVLGPLTSLLDRVSGTLGRALNKTRPTIESALARVHDNNRQAVRKHIGLAHEKIGRALGESTAGSTLASQKEFAAALLPAADVESRYETGLADFESWKKQQFDALVGDIRTKKSAQLFILQVLYVTMTVTTMAHTGGALTLLEGIAAGPIIVALDKMFVGAINWDLVRDLEARARTRFFALFSEFTTEQSARWDRFFAKEETGLSPLPSLTADIAELRRDVPALLDQLEKR